MRALLSLALIPAALVSAAFAPAALADMPISDDAAWRLKQEIAGQYRLETGRDVRLTLIGDDLYLDLNRHYRAKLLPVADNMLASRDGRLTVRYMPDGRVDEILIRHPGLPPRTRIGELRWRMDR